MVFFSLEQGSFLENWEERIISANQQIITGEDESN